MALSITTFSKMTAEQNYLLPIVAISCTLKVKIKMVVMLNVVAPLDVCVKTVLVHR
jgi:hypothetical protein